uniref:Uncharacterized protein n=1 Tax=Zea mays TaxID=4577 RepID=A0A804N6E5_MAIZE
MASATGVSSSEMAVDHATGPGAVEKPRFDALTPNEMSGGRPQFRKVPMPQHRFAPLKRCWMEIYKPVYEHMKIDIRMNLKVLDWSLPILGFLIAVKKLNPESVQGLQSGRITWRTSTLSVRMESRVQGHHRMFWALQYSCTNNGNPIASVRIGASFTIPWFYYIDHLGWAGYIPNSCPALSDARENDCLRVQL